MKRLGLLVACLALTGCNGGTVDQHALSNDGDAVDSLACEGRLLASDVADGDTTTRFTRVHAGELQQRAANFEDALAERPTEAAIERDVRALAGKAGRIARLLDRLRREASNPEGAKKLEALLAKEGDCS
jgi:hypothetical protein